MFKTIDCHHWQFYVHNPHLVCAVHPQGMEGKCLDFRQDPNSRASEGEQWNPEGYYWWDSELYPIRRPTLVVQKSAERLDMNGIAVRGSIV